ncbi:MAG: transglutaminase-like cysteine peptidase [Devosiaceae bacterium]|nr:transglutaminase-like cysteine peptidase [Devosiaceae bacterium]
MTIYKNKLFAILSLMFLMLLASTDLAFANLNINFNNLAFAKAGNVQTSIPIGHAEFCKIWPKECGKNKENVSAITLTQALWQELVGINVKYNKEIIPVTDLELYGVEEFWTYSNGYGDCEEYVLEKRRALINLGWPASVLLIAVLRQESGEGHAVLMVRTDRGDLVLDNQAALIKLWNETPYKYLKRQSQANSGQWVDLYDQRENLFAKR